MSEKLFFHLYWRPYKLIMLCIALVVFGSALPRLVPRTWMVMNTNNYGYYVFKTTAWIIKFSMALYVFALVRALMTEYFPLKEKIATQEVRAVIVDYSHSWTRGKQLCPIFEYTVDGNIYREVLNESKGVRRKTGDEVEKGFTLGMARRIMYNVQHPEFFYLPGELMYKRTFAVMRFVMFSLVFFAELYFNVFRYLR